MILIGVARALGPVSQFGHACFGRAVIATEHPAIAFQSVADDTNCTMRADWCEYVDRAFKAVEGEMLALHGDLK